MLTANAAYEKAAAAMEDVEEGDGERKMELA